MTTFKDQTEMKKTTILAILAGSLFFSSLAFAVEVDDISTFYEPLRDSMEVLNKQVNQQLQAAAEKTQVCEGDRLAQNLFDIMKPRSSGFGSWVDRLFYGGLEVFAANSPEVDRVKRSTDQSIYRDSPMAHAALSRFARGTGFGDLSASIRLNGKMIGTDKLSHFFETGHELRAMPFLRGDPDAEFTRPQVLALIDESIRLEEDELGLTITGIKSYGDLNAHLAGAFFWKELASSKGKWWKCENRKIKLVRDFDFKDYVHDGWSEAINCNQYAVHGGGSSIFSWFAESSIPFAEAIQTNTQKLENETGRRYQCPIDPAGCARAKDHLRNLIPQALEKVNELVSPECH